MAEFIFVFKSSAFDLSWPTNHRQAVSQPLGRDLAQYLKEMLIKHAIQVRGPFEGEDGWMLELELNNEQFDVFVQCAAFGDPGDECWVIQPAKKIGVLRTLFGRPKPGVGVEPLCTILDAVLRNNPRIQTLRTLDWESFRALY